MSIFGRIKILPCFILHLRVLFLVTSIGGENFGGKIACPTWMKQRYILRNDLLGSLIFQGGVLADNFSFMGKFWGTI